MAVNGDPELVAYCQRCLLSSSNSPLDNYVSVREDLPFTCTTKSVCECSQTDKNPSRMDISMFIL